MRFLSIIPARGGSKAVPKKNVRILAGKPLIAHTIITSLAAPGIDRTIVSTEDSEIAEISRYFGAEVIDRPPELAGDTAPTRPVLEHVVQTLAQQDYVPDAIVTLQPTSPLRRIEHIEEALTLFRADPRADSLVSSVTVPHIYHPCSVMRLREDGYMAPFLNTPQPTRRQEKEPVFARNGAAIYITRASKLQSFIFGGRLIGYLMDSKASLDIDSEEDFALAVRYLTEEK